MGSGTARFALLFLLAGAACLRTSYSAAVGVESGGVVF